MHLDTLDDIIFTILFIKNILYLILFYRYDNMSQIVNVVWNMKDFIQVTLNSDFEILICILNF